jgi:hypothetical protein
MLGTVAADAPTARATGAQYPAQGVADFAHEALLSDIEEEGIVKAVLAALEEPTHAMMEAGLSAAGDLGLRLLRLSLKRRRRRLLHSACGLSPEFLKNGSGLVKAAAVTISASVL